MAADISLHDQESAQLRRLSLLFLVSGLCLFPLIFGTFLTFFPTNDQADNLQRVEAHATLLRLLVTGIGITEIALGVALFLWGRHVSRHTPGRRRDLARVLGWVGLVAGCSQFVAWSFAWFRSTESLGANVTGGATWYFNEAGGLALSMTFLIFGWLMIRGAMPTWLGVVWVACGLMYWLGRLPLWFFVAAITFGIWGLIGFRPGRDAASRTSALPPVTT